MTTGFGPPCGACKFLRRKCAKGCVFAPHFCHEQGAAHFAAIHKVFGASNASKLLSHLPISHRSEAAMTISYEARARLQDPIYGCVSHILSLQQQVVGLQSQIASLRNLAEQRLALTSNGNTTNNNHQDMHNWHQSANPNWNQFANEQNFPSYQNVHFGQTNLMNVCSNSFMGNSGIGTLEVNSFVSFEETSEQSFGSTNFDDDFEYLAFGYIQES